MLTAFLFLERNGIKRMAGTMKSHPNLRVPETITAN
jgi:hypothetical protein